MYLNLKYKYVCFRIYNFNVKFIVSCWLLFFFAIKLVIKLFLFLERIIKESVAQNEIKEINAQLNVSLICLNMFV